MKNIIIFDGNNLLFQMFYGFPAKIFNKSHETIHATIGFISYILKEIKLYDADEAVVVFDGDSASDRLDIYEDYKGNRPTDWDTLPPEEVPFNEEPKIDACLAYLGVKAIRSEGTEADDFIATIALKESKNAHVIISSFDSDFFQLIGPNIDVVRYRGKASAYYNESSFKDKFGYPAARYAFWKSLCGDSADNIPGIPGIGKVTATKIASRYSCLEEAIQDQNGILTPKIKDKLQNGKEVVMRNLTLIQLKEKDIYLPSEFGFDKEKILLSNSAILSACHIFD